MSTSTAVIPLNPVDPRELFDAAREAARNTEKWTLFDGPGYGAVHMYLTRPRPGIPLVSVHFPAAGGALDPREMRSDAPAGYAEVHFSGSPSSDPDVLWRHHAGLVRDLSQWLGTRGIRWAWSFEDDPWSFGVIPHARGARASVDPRSIFRIRYPARTRSPLPAWPPRTMS